MQFLRLVFFIISVAFVSNVTAQTVYTTKTGEKYHKSNCHYLKYSKNEIDIKKAKELGYKACKVCKPTESNTKVESSKVSSLRSESESKKSRPTSEKVNATRCTGKTKKGSRCKRMTKSSNGRCYQH